MNYARKLLLVLSGLATSWLACLEPLPGIKQPHSIPLHVPWMMRFQETRYKIMYLMLKNQYFLHENRIAIERLDRLIKETQEMQQSLKKTSRVLSDGLVVGISLTQADSMRSLAALTLTTGALIYANRRSGIDKKIEHFIEKKVLRESSHAKTAAPIAYKLIESGMLYATACYVASVVR